MPTRRSSLVNFRNVAPRSFIIYPESNNTYRMLQYFLCVLSIYSCFISLYLKTFKRALPLYVAIIETIVNGFFLLDIILSLFFVAYLDKKTLVIVDNRMEIFWNALKPAAFGIFLIVPFEFIERRFHPSSPAYQIFTAVCFFRLSRATRIHRLISELEEKEIEYLSFTYVRMTKMIWVCSFVCHCGGCFFYFIARLHQNPKNTWLYVADPNFLNLSSIKQYMNSVYWAITSFSTVGYGDLHPMKIWEKIFSIGFLFINIGVVAYVVGNITHVLAPDVGPTGRYRARRLRVLSFCRQHNLSMHLQNEVSTHLKLEYVSNLEPSEEHGIFKSLPMPIRKMILSYLYNNYVADNYLFEGVSNALQLQLVHGMEPVFFLANSTVILQDEVPACFYFVVRGSVELKSFKDGVERDVGTTIAGNVFGQSCVLCNKPQLFTAKTREVCQLLKLDRDTLFEILKENPIATSNIMHNEILLLKELLEEHNDLDMNDVLSEIERKKATIEATGIA